jgi:site-specific recombinase XerD
MMLEQFISYLDAQGKSPRTLNTYKTQLIKFMEWLKEHGGTSDPKQITSIDAVEYRRSLDKKGLMPASINTALASIEAFCNWMKDQGFIDHNPLERVDRMEQVLQAPKWLTKTEKYRVIRTSLIEKDKRNSAIILTLLMTGIRVSELVHIKPEDIMLGDRKGILVVKGKGNKRRSIPIPKDLRECLGDYLVDDRATANWVFASQRGEQLTVKGVQHLCASISKKANVSNLTPHVLRHTYCHDLVQQGVDIGMVSKLAGHSKLDTTLIYTQPGEEEMQAAVEKLSFT